MNLVLPDHIIQATIDRWEDCQGVPQTQLLRLAILREFIQSLHSEKSRCLAEGKKDQAHAIKAWEEKVEALRCSSSLGDDDFLHLTQLKETESDIKRRNLPEALFQNLDRKKLERYDRKWESTLAAEAVRIGWKFWNLDIWIAMSQIEDWTNTLAAKLWPHGLILFSESSNQGQIEISQQENEPSSWRGVWLILLDAAFKHPSELSLQFHHWPGSANSSKTPPQWKLIYPEK